MESIVRNEKRADITIKRHIHAVQLKKLVRPHRTGLLRPDPGAAAGALAQRAHEHAAIERRVPWKDVRSRERSTEHLWLDDAVAGDVPQAGPASET